MLIPNILELKILAACKELTNNPNLSMEDAQSQFAQKLASAIHSYITSATIIVPPGQVVVGASPAGPVTGAVTSPINATIT